MKFLCAGLLALMPFLSQAQNSQTISIIAGAGPGGVTDMQARAVSDFFNSKGLKSIVVNKSGANQLIASNYVANQVGDSKTLLLGSMSNTAIPIAEKSDLAQFDENTLTPIGYVGFTNFVFVVNKDKIKSRTLTEFLNEFSADHEKINFGTPGPLLTYAMRDIVKSTKKPPTFIQYKSTPQILFDVLSGNIQAGLVDVSTAMQHIREDKVVALGVVSRSRSKTLPQIPAIREVIKDFELVGGWFGLFAPPGVSADVVAEYSRLLNEMHKSPDYQERFEKMSIQQQSMSSREFSAFYKDQIAQFRSKSSGK